MEERYKLQYFDSACRSGKLDFEHEVLSIDWARDKRSYLLGDCRVRAILESTDAEVHNKKHFQSQDYSEPMTLEEAREYVAKDTEMLGEVHDCVGLSLEDVCKVVDFPKPIEIRNVRNL